MTYASGTIAADANPGPLLYAALETPLLAAGFTLVDTVVIGGRTHKVLESDAADNDRGLTWYLDVSYPTTGITGGMLMVPFEGYNSTTHVATRGIYAASNTTIDGTTYSRFGATTSALETNWNNTASSSASDNPIVTTGFGWFMSATTDRVIFLSTTAPAELHYVGFFEPTADHVTAAGAALYPLIMVHFAFSSAVPVSGTAGANSTVNFTRVPPMTSINWSTSAIIDISFAMMGGLVGGGGNFVATGKTNLARRPIVMGYNALAAASAASATGGMGLVGYLIDIANSWTDGSVVRGDDLTDTNADVWIGTDDSSNVGLWFKAV
jgi:hypothetical protein